MTEEEALKIASPVWREPRTEPVPKEGVARAQVHEMSDQIRVLRAEALGRRVEIGYEDARDILVHDAAVAAETLDADELERFAEARRRAGS